ncbi:hypothetical protein V8F06_013573 [Rhypophila decipiens]
MTKGQLRWSLVPRGFICLSAVAFIVLVGVAPLTHRSPFAHEPETTDYRASQGAAMVLAFCIALAEGCLVLDSYSRLRGMAMNARGNQAC